MNLIPDLSFGLRTLRRSPGFTCVAILTLALGISANAALYSVVRAVLLTSRGYADPAHLVQIAGTNKAGQGTGVSIPDLAAFQSRARSFERIGTYRVQTFTLIGPHEPENIYGNLVSSDFFDALGATPLAGRPFHARDFQPGAPPVALIAHSLWKSAFDGDPAVIGRRILLNGSDTLVIGVMRPEFEFPMPAFRIWTPWPFTGGDLSNHTVHNFTLVARLRSGATRESAQAELQSLSQALAGAFPVSNTGWRAAVQPLNDQIYGGLRPILLTLLGAVGFVLLIACMNVSNLLMARGVERTREMALRAALGASRARLIRQLLTESLLIAAAGGVFGLVLAKGWLRLLIALLPARTFSILPGAETAALDLRVLAVCALATVAAGVLFGCLPALRLSATNLEEPLKEAARSNTGGFGRRRFFTGLVILETALSVTLLAGAGLLIRSFHQKVSAPLGFHPDQWTSVTQRNDPTLSRVVSESVAQSGLYTVMLACFAGLALLLAAAGIFSVIAWTVSQSTHEIGIRMALGATPGRILRSAMSRSLAGAAMGAALGLGGAALLTRLLTSQLYGVTATDPVTFVLTPIVLLLVAWLAAYLPARRATRIDPMAALRSE